MRQLQFLVFFLLYFLHPSLSSSSFQSQSLRYKLHRRSPHRRHHAFHLKPLYLSDLQRQHWIRSTIKRNLANSDNYHPTCHQSTSEAFEMPIGSGAYTGIGQYFVRVRVGTPAKPFLLVADTGSDLTWVKCRRHHSNGIKEKKYSGGARVFKPEQSSSWSPIGCSTDLCKKTLPFALATCPVPDSPCVYDYGYSDGSRAKGIFANESATITLSSGNKTKLHGLVVGCTTNSSGLSFGSSDGVLGLGYSTTSFASLASSIFGGLFSYCLVDHLAPRNLSSLLTFGPTIFTSLVLSTPHITPLILDSRLSPFYSVSVKYISVDNETLDIPSKVWDINSGGGTILDSGTSLTVLADPAYKVVVSALSRKLAGLPQVKMDPFDYCYNWTSIKAKPEVHIPKLVLHFEGAARLEPPSKSYIIDVANGVKCIGITSAPWPGTSTIGNILQQEHVWEFDIRKKQLRFEHSKCQQH
ncbi:aspartic proteinase nepenthesin-2-like protein [Carex littledalei]|uniref:Aspartic proteinase nepenthesin-2-like protein n=1 Tax=Carex littledalei TaxID=544730 RepID=A0A833RED3_9POAL|nr:aspartic proteinase nepenthesin-2-like protein [Carex littledalei]